MSDRMKALVDEQLRNFDSLPEKVKEEIEWRVDQYKANLIRVVRESDSPIEQLLHPYILDVSENLRDSLAEMDKDSSVACSPQSEVLINDKKYRPDFCLTCRVNKEQYNFVIECDGHDFHEKTKEQVSKDKKRERDLMSCGYVVIRFTGSEIWRNPFECSKETQEIIEKHLGITDFWINYFKDD